MNGQDLVSNSENGNQQLEQTTQQLMSLWPSQNNQSGLENGPLFTAWPGADLHGIQAEKTIKVADSDVN